LLEKLLARSGGFRLSWRVLKMPTQSRRFERGRCFGILAGHVGRLQFARAPV